MSTLAELNELFTNAIRNSDREVWTTSNADAEWRGSARTHFSFKNRFCVVVPSGATPDGDLLDEEFAVSAFENFLSRGKSALDRYTATGHSHHLDDARSHAAVVTALAAQ